MTLGGFQKLDESYINTIVNINNIGKILNWVLIKKTEELQKTGYIYIE